MLKHCPYIFLISSFFICNLGYGQSHFARQSGDWDQTDRWSTVATGGASCGCVPGAGDNVLIDGYDIVIDAGTGNVTVADIKITNDRNEHVLLQIEGGITFTVTNDFEIEGNTGSRDAELIVEDDNTLLAISGDFLADLNDGDDLIVEVEDNAAIRISGTSTFLQDGGDDIVLNLNNGSGNSAEFYSQGAILFDHDGGDDIKILIDDANSELLCDDDFTVSLNTGNDDDFELNMDNGILTIDGDFILNRANGTAEIELDIDGGNLTMENVIITSSGPLYNDGAVFLYLDNAATFECTNFTSTFTGADDLYIHLNEGPGTAAELTVTNNMTLIRSAGDDIDILIDDDNSVLSVGNDFSVTSSGTDSEEFEFRLDNDATVEIGGDFSVTITNGQDAGGNLHILHLAGGGDSPTFTVDGDFSWTSSINLVDIDIDLDGGILSVGGDMTLTQNAGADDFDVALDEDAILNVTGDFEMTLNGGDDMSLNLGLNSASTAQLNVGGNVLLDHNNATGGVEFEHFIYDDTRFNISGNLTLACNQNTSAKFIQDIQNEAEVIVDGNIIFRTSFADRVEISLIDDSFLRIGGNFVRSAAPNQFGILDCSGGGNPTVEFMGVSNQEIAEDAGNGGDFFYYHNLEVNNTFDTNPQLSMQGLATVHSNIALNDGVVASDAINILVVDDNATSTGASDMSHVDGYMRKVGDDDFTFPSGDDDIYAPISIAGVAASTEQFEAQYFHVKPDDAGYDETAIPGTIDHISHVEYWLMNRTAGASNPTVTLSWSSPRSGGVVTPAALRFARWDGANWNDEGVSNLTGVPDAGTLDNNIAITTFSDTPFTLASTIVTNPLPVELLSFTANLNDNRVNLKWETASEINNDYFIAEVSTNGLDWTNIDRVQGAGNSSSHISYDLVDNNPAIGFNYYRLKQVDFDGQYEYSDVEIVEYSKGANFLVYPNPASDIITIKYNEVKPQFIQLMNLNGQKIDANFVESQGAITGNISDLSSGVYMLNIDGKTNKIIIRH